MNQSTATRCKYVVLIVASVIICQFSNSCSTQVQAEFVNEFSSRFMTPLESRFRGNGLDQVEKAVLVDELSKQSNIVNSVGQVEREILAQELQQQPECVFGSSCLPIEEAAKEARIIVRGQTHGQLSTFLTGKTAFNESLIGTPVSSVEMFVEDCDSQYGNGDLLVLGSELTARNLENEITKASILVQGKYLDSMSPKLQQYAMEVQSFEQPIVHKVEVVLVGHMEKIDSLSEKFLAAKQCIKRVHPEIEMIESVMPQRFGVWRFKIDGGVHMIDHMRKFVGWIPLEKYHTIVAQKIESLSRGPLSLPSEMIYGPSMQMSGQFRYPIHFENTPIEREILSGQSNVQFGQMGELERMTKWAMYKRMQQNMMNQSELPLEWMNGVNGLPVSPFGRKIMQLRRMRQIQQFGTEYPKYQYINKYSGLSMPEVVIGGEYPQSISQFSGSIQKPSVVVSTPWKQQQVVDANMISPLSTYN